MCEGCGAPLQLADFQCSYCKRATMHAVPPASYRTTVNRSPDGKIVGVETEAVAAGWITPNEARQRAGLAPITPFIPDQPQPDVR